MSASVIPAAFRCRRAPLGWTCARAALHVGPCLVRPVWYNLPGIIAYAELGIYWRNLRKAKK